MNSKTDNGVTVTAHQRVKTDEEIPVNGLIVCTGSMGELIISCSTGDERGIKIKATIALDEVLAWIPEMTEEARKHSAAKAKQKLSNDLRQEGIHIETCLKSR